MSVLLLYVDQEEKIISKKEKKRKLRSMWMGIWMARSLYTPNITSGKRKRIQSKQAWRAEWEYWINWCLEDEYPILFFFFGLLSYSIPLPPLTFLWSYYIHYGYMGGPRLALSPELLWGYRQAPRYPLLYLSGALCLIWLATFHFQLGGAYRYFIRRINPYSFFLYLLRPRVSTGQEYT